MQTLAPVLNLEIIESTIVPTLHRMASDPIPNIRFNVAKAYHVIMDVLKRLPETGTIHELEQGQGPQTNGDATGSMQGRHLVEEQILPDLEKLEKDEDVDVRYFATNAQQSWGDAMDTMQG